MTGIAPIRLVERSEPNRREPRVYSSPVLRNLSQITSEPIRWLWPQRIPLGKLTIIAGDPGLGKSFATLDLAARVSSGRGWPDQPSACFESGGVILLSAEDDLGDTIKPRLVAAGAELSQIVALDAVQHHCGGEEHQAMFSLATDMLRLEEAIDSVGNCRLVVIDPITAYCGGTDSHKNAEVRGLLAPLADLATRKSVAVVAVSHLNKSNQGPAIYRTMGSLAFVAAARAAFGVVTDRDDKQRRLFLPVKTNLSPHLDGLAFSIQTKWIAGPHGELASATVEWEPEPVEISVDEAMGSPIAGDDDQDAEAWLQEALEHGPMPSTELLYQAKQHGFSNKVIRKAFKRLGGTTKKDGFGPGRPWIWSLSEAMRP